MGGGKEGTEEDRTTGLTAGQTDGLAVKNEKWPRVERFAQKQNETKRARKDCHFPSSPVLVYTTDSASF